MQASWWLSGKESTCNAGDAGDTVSTPGWDDPLEEEMATHSSILPLQYSGGLQPIGSESNVTKHAGMLRFFFVCFFQLTEAKGPSPVSLYATGH